MVKALKPTIYDCFSESDTKDLDSNSRNGAQPKKRSLISKNETKNAKKPKEQSSKPASASKDEDKKQKKAALDAARLVASRLLQNNVPDSVLQKQSDVVVNTHPLPIQTASTSSSIIDTKQHHLFHRYKHSIAQKELHYHNH